MWWVWVIIFGLIIVLGFEVRSKDVFDHVLELEDNVRRLREEIAALKDEILKK